MIKYYKRLSKEEKQIAIRRIAVRIHTSEKIIIEILNTTNPLLAIKNGEVIMYRHTLTILRMKVKEYDSKKL